MEKELVVGNGGAWRALAIRGARAVMVGGRSCWRQRSHWDSAIWERRRGDNTPLYHCCNSFLSKWVAFSSSSNLSRSSLLCLCRAGFSVSLFILLSVFGDCSDERLLLKKRMVCMVCVYAKDRERRQYGGFQKGCSRSLLHNCEAGMRCVLMMMGCGESGRAVPWGVDRARVAESSGAMVTHDLPIFG